MVRLLIYRSFPLCAGRIRPDALVGRLDVAGIYGAQGQGKDPVHREVPRSILGLNERAFD